MLIPAVAPGRAQELLLIFDENGKIIWNSIIRLSIMFLLLPKKCLTYTLSMNDRIQNTKSNPFSCKHISAVSSIDVFKDVGPSVMMASPGGLQSGLSQQLYDMWCSDKKNTLALYLVQLPQFEF